MEIELAAVEEDVERKRVGKNPFDEKFTALVIQGDSRGFKWHNKLESTTLYFSTTRRPLLPLRRMLVP